MPTKVTIRAWLVDGRGNPLCTYVRDAVLQAMPSVDDRVNFSDDLELTVSQVVHYASTGRCCVELADNVCDSGERYAHAQDRLRAAQFSRDEVFDDEAHTDDLGIQEWYEDTLAETEALVDAFTLDEAAPVHAGEPFGGKDTRTPAALSSRDQTVDIRTPRS